MTQDARQRKQSALSFFAKAASLPGITGPEMRTETRAHFAVGSRDQPPPQHVPIERIVVHSRA